MLVCNVSLRAPRPGIEAEIAETIEATDATATGFVVFATLVDDPASVSETVDAFVGDIMLEATSAADSVSTVSIYDVAVVEAATIVDTQSGGLGAALTTFDSTTASAGVSLSNGALTVTYNSGGGAPGARSGSYQTTGKYYFEITCGTMTVGGQNGIGIIASTETYNNALNASLNTSVTYANSGYIFTNNGGSLLGPLGAWGTGDIIGVAVDLTARKVWMRKNGGNWNANASHDPATNAGGGPVSSGAFSPFVGFNNSQQPGDNMTANFGQATFSSAAPSGFTGWPA